MENKDLYATLTLYGDPTEKLVDEVRLAIHDAEGNLVFATYWETDVMDKEEIKKAINAICANYNVKDLFSSEEVFEPEYEIIDGQKMRIFRANKVNS
ncbi:hypothetical protein [Hydrogenothermus marinus]|uniref:Uncharacterized protein n=1 Tax=Hydrogenothermus marinus TaxID=133270 RepID=A0A3M0BRM0_9AQUI|nr:hypothetical protein [Hydrogenothermus marinus]RMA97145.1 hypothetical protein CLV39_0800 [Hydrogenothermus marinus]